MSDQILMPRKLMNAIPIKAVKMNVMPTPRRRSGYIRVLGDAFAYGGDGAACAGR